jgi:hypothetical protein
MSAIIARLLDAALAAQSAMGTRVIGAAFWIALGDIAGFA